MTSASAHQRPSIPTDNRILIGRSARHIVRSPDALLISFVLPVFQLLLFVYVFGGAIATGTDYVNYVTPGIILVAAGFGASLTATAVNADLTGAGRCRDKLTGLALPDDACNDLGDEDIDDFENLDLADVIGGSKMFLMNLEMQVPISEELGLTGILFFDMGNAFAENESFSPDDLRFGTGGGIQWFSPFGPIMLILGFPLDPLEDEDNSVFEFSLGGAPY